MAKLLKTSSDKSSKHTNPLITLQNEMDKALHGFYDLFESKPFNFHLFENIKIAPKMDLIEDKNGYKIEFEMAGMDEKDIKVSVHQNMLTISGEKTISKKDDRRNFIAREISYGSYQRSISLPQNADCNKIKASFKKGMLWVTIPKKSISISKQQEIKVEKA